MSFRFRVVRVGEVEDNELFVRGTYENERGYAELGSLVYIEGSSPRIEVAIVSYPLVNYRYPRQDDLSLLIVSAPRCDPEFLIGKVLVQ